MPDARSAAGPPQVNPWLVAVSVMFGTFMEVLDTTVVNVSLPHIAGSLSSTIDEATWALTSYLVANAIILPLTGWLAAYFGRKRLLIFAVSGFTISSLLCGLAPNLAVLIIFRLVQGATGGVLQPISQAVMLEAFPPEDRGKAMGFWGLGIVVAPMLGPVIGGWLTDNYSWRWVFYINLPVGILSVIMANLFVFDPPYLKRERRGIDYWGIGLLAVGIGALQFVLDKGQQEDWFGSDLIVTLALVAGAAIVGFIVWELVIRHPVVDLRALKERTFASGVTLMTVVGFVLYGSLVLLPEFLQVLLGYPALQAGIAMAPRGMGSFIGMPLVGMILSKVDARKMLAIGVFGTSFTLYQLAQLNLQAGYWDIFWPQFIQGLSLSMLFVPLTTVSMSPISREKMGNATSIFNLMRNLGGSMGIATATTLIARREQLHINQLGEHVTAYDSGTRQMLGQMQGALQAQGSDAVSAAHRAQGAVFGLVERQATLLAYLDVFRTMGIVFLCVLPLLLIMRRAAKGKGPVASH